MIDQMKQILILNGPNLNLLGKRQPEVYGSQSFDEYLDLLRPQFPTLHITYFQSNHEGALIDKIHEVGFSFDGLVINAGGLTHTSVALADAIASVPMTAIEVHISNIHARESFRHHSYLSAVCKGMICGLGLPGYKMALGFFLD